MKVKCYGLVGRHNWTDRSYIEVKYEQIYGRNYNQIVTVHFDFDSYEEQKAVWGIIEREIDDGLYDGMCLGRLAHFLVGCYNSCCSSARKDGTRFFEVERMLQVYWLDGHGKMRVGIPERAKVGSYIELPKVVDREGIEF